MAVVQPAGPWRNRNGASAAAVKPNTMALDQPLAKNQKTAEDLFFDMQEPANRFQSAAVPPAKKLPPIARGTRTGAPSMAKRRPPSPASVTYIGMPSS
jgi:hypothetical protein